MENKIKHTIISCLILILNQSMAQETWNVVGGGYFGIPSGSSVESFKVIDGKLYVGGGFVWTGTVTAHGIAVWDGYNWDSLGSGLWGRALSIEKYNNEIYAGGSFTMPYEVWPPQYRYLSKWNGSQWNSVGNKTPSSVVYALKYKNDLFVAGSYYYLIDTGSQAQTPVRNITKWNGSSWSAVGGGVGGSVAPSIYAMTEYNGELIVAGQFQCVGPQGNCDWSGYYGIARWDGMQWGKLDSGLNAGVVSLLVDTVNDMLYAGGDFTGTILQVEGSVAIRNIGKWDGNKWSSLPGDSILPVNSIYALSIYNGFLYAGIPNTAYDTNFVRFDGRQWEVLNNPSSSVLALGVYQSDLFVGGGFDHVNGDSSMRYLARFNTPNYCDSVSTSFSVSADTVELSDSAMVQGIPSGFSNQYQWDFDDSTAIDTAQFPTHYFSKDGVYTIKLKSTFGFCPWDSATKTVVVVNDVGIDEFQISDYKLKIYPNPADGSFTVEIQNSLFAIQNSSFKIYDVKGKLVKQMAINSKQMTIETKGWGKGVYFVKLIAGGKIVAKEKVILE